MSWFHKHNWYCIAKTYAPSAKEQGLFIKKCDHSEIGLILFMGQTTIVWECTVCKEIKKEKLLGKEVDVI